LSPSPDQQHALIYGVSVVIILQAIIIQVVLFVDPALTSPAAVDALTAEILHGRSNRRRAIGTHSTATTIEGPAAMALGRPSGWSAIDLSVLFTLSTALPDRLTC
jgi:hypothetical protein